MMAATDAQFSKGFSPFSFRYSPSKANTAQPSIVQHCQYYVQYFTNGQIKDLHQQFSRILSSIFGFNGFPGWSLKTCNRKVSPNDFNAAYALLGAKGKMFELIARLDHEQYQYEFPVKCLPPPSQAALAQGLIPPFYQKKINLLLLEMSQGTMDHIQLSAFEYYMFNFSYYLIHQVQKRDKFQWAPLQDCLYSELLNAYLYHFLPPSGPIPNPHSLISSPSGMGTGTSLPVKSHMQQSPSTPTHSNIKQFPIHSPVSHTPLGLLKINGTSSHRSGMNMYSSVGSFYQNETPTETFLNIFVEFWLNQLTADDHRGNFSTQTQNNLCCHEYTRLLRMFVKHILYFYNGSSHLPSPSHSPFSSPLSIATDSLRSSVINDYIQKHCYKLLCHAFQHWPLDENFRYVLELWLTYIQPWRYTDPNKPSAENKGSLENVPSKWKSYLMDNFPFYSSLLLLFLDRSFQLDLTSDIGATLLYRTCKVFSQPGLQEYIASGEYLMLYSHPDSTHKSLTPPTSSVEQTSLKALFISLEGTMFEYHPLFLDQDTIEAVKVLIGNVQQARSQLQTQQSPHSHSTEYASTKDGKGSWFSSLWHDLFSDEATPPFQRSPNRHQVDPNRLKTLLEDIEANLRTFFGLPSQGIPPISSVPTPFDGSPVLRPFSPPSAFSVNISSSLSGQAATPPNSIEAEYYNGTCHLTPEGREQVTQGLRLCSKSRIVPLTDPMLSPICTYENPTLVRLLYQLSCYLNNKFSSQLLTVSNSSNIFCRLLLQLLSPPPPPQGPTHILPHSTEPPSTPVTGMSKVIPIVQEEDRPYRINLRLFGSYYTLGYLFLLLSLLWLLSVPLLLVAIVMLLLICFYCILKYALSK